MKLWKKKEVPRKSVFSSLIKVRGAKLRNLASGTHIETRPQPPRSWMPRGMNRVMSGHVGGGGNWKLSLDYNSQNRGDFFRWMRDSIPLISAGVCAWVSLCATRLEQRITGNAGQKHTAAKLLDSLNNRVLELPVGYGSGFLKLTEAYFLEAFTTGKFAGEAVLAKDGKSIDHFRYIDPYLISWEHDDKGWIPIVHDLENGTKIRIAPERFFFNTLTTDLNNPTGPEPLASIPFVAEIDQLMLEDMARSSHNAGTPRMQIKITRPERHDLEGDNEYASRVNTYFQGLVNEFSSLEPDDNMFTWSDVDVSIVGKTGFSHQWRLGREQIIEDVITGLKLYPWVLGRSHRSTQNWAQAQFDLLMEATAHHQQSGADLIDWLCNLELKLQGVEAKVSHSFSGHRDPFKLERANAEKVELQNIEFKVANGYISRDEGAVEMGYPAAYKKVGE